MANVAPSSPQAGRKKTVEPREYALMFELERHHWWFQSRVRMIERLLDAHVWPSLGEQPRLIDLGCGTGLFLERHQKHCRTTGLDFSQHALKFSRRAGLRNLCQGDAARLPYADGSADLITAFDLIEHVPDDQGLVRDAWRVLRPGGFLVATVPAHPILWTGHDVSLHHKRRYRRAEFDALFRQDGPWQWETLRMTAGFCIVFPIAVAMRLARRLIGDSGVPVSDAHPMPEGINRFLMAINRPEIAWLARHDLPFGVSYFTIRRKPAA
jgi:SAM-dependent methyltransferase